MFLMSEVPLYGAGFESWGVGLSVQGSSCAVKTPGGFVGQGSGCRMQGLSFKARVQVAGCGLRVAGCGVQGTGCRVQGTGCHLAAAELLFAGSTGEIPVGGTDQILVQTV